MLKCCAYQPRRSVGRIFFGYQNSTNPGSDQLAVPTRILPACFGADAFAITSQRNRTVSERKCDSGKIAFAFADGAISRSEEHTSELQSHSDLVCRLLL